jgi:Ca2+-binding EF-hand superfamily protein|eukprot:Tamp_23211.p1 GENE.Tamp_23211~~Tamp_23211.p1  ORF type:complete len:211 (+),score=61.56 Tamp_23211:79-711(+)
MPVGNAAAIIAMRRARERQNNAGPSKNAAKKRAQAAREQEIHWRKVEKEKMVANAIARYDKSGNGKLDRAELSGLLQQLAGGEAPTAEECGYVLRMADATDDGLIGADELERAIKIWKGYLACKDDIEQKMAKYDTNQSGKLETNQLKMMLTDLNDGRPPTDEEVQMVMEEADGKVLQSTGGVNKTELNFAISVWYCYVEDQRSACCALM